MLVALGLIALGFVFLIFGADLTVKGGVAIANKLNIAPVIIGLTILAFGTSAPEFVVSIKAALNDAEGIVLGNIIGSNIGNIFLILGLASAIKPIEADKKVFFRDYKFLLAVTILFAVISYFGNFSLLHGLLMLALLFGFIAFNYVNAMKNPPEENNEETHSPYASKSWLIVSLVTIAGLVAIIFGGDLLVKGAVSIAEHLGVSQEIIGLTIIAFGTSLPELAVSVIAAMRGQSAMALGNVVGSNIWNIVFIMGITATMTNVEVPQQFIVYDNIVMLAGTLILWPIMMTKGKISRTEGIVMFIAYCAYIVSQVLITQGVINFG
ncbi:MAG: calcium/sodium antiporter [Alphaproteobacteria bacterium]